MGDRHDPATDQPAPIPNHHSRIHELVMDDVEDRMELGIRKYGTALQPHNGRDALLDAYHEALDLAIYLKQALVEREETR